MATLIEKNTKKLIEHKLDALFAKQQQLNGNAGSNNSLPKAEVGWLSSMKYKAPDAEPLNLPSYDSYTNKVTSAPIMTFSNPLDNPNSPYFDPAKSKENTLKASGMLKGEGPNWGKIGTFAAQTAPVVYNMIKGLQRPEKTVPNYNPYESSARSLMANRRFNVNPLLNANITAQAVSNRNIRNAANSRGELMANLGSAQNARMAADSAAFAQKNNMDNQYLGQQAEMDAGLGAQRAQMDWMTQDANSRNRAATNAFLGQGFNDLSRFAQTQQLMGNQKYRDAQLASLYPDMYSQIYQFQPFMQDIVKRAQAEGGLN